jgi:hypothetical protein
MGEVRDGLSNTIVLGEKYIRQSDYHTGADWGDNEAAFNGFNNDNHRSTHPYWRYQRDGDVLSIGSFGSAHAIGNFVLADGSVHSMAYGIDATTFRHLGNRSDGQSSKLE